MLRTFIKILLLTFGFSLSLISMSLANDESNQFLALCYHNVEDSDPDQTFNGTATAHFIEELSWLYHEGYQSVSIDDLLNAKSGKKPLPPKAVLLTFDDGYESFYTRVYPILKTFHYHAVLAIVDEWMEDNNGTQSTPGDTLVHFGSVYVPRSVFLTWPQVRDMVASGLVEVASHSDTLHTGVVANKEGNSEPAITTAIYDKKTSSLEDRDAYYQRLDKDAAHSTKILTEKLGHSPRAMVWPYGTYNKIALSIATKHGMPITFTLDSGMGRTNTLDSIPRQLIDRDPSLMTFTYDMQHVLDRSPIRVVQVDLDYVFDPNPEQMARNLDSLINRIHDLQINTVFLQAFSDPEGTGMAHQLYFPNRHMGMRADLFNRVVWQLKTRAKVRVYGWLPVLSFDLGRDVPTVKTDASLALSISDSQKLAPRVSPFDPKARRLIHEIYEDMARAASIDGILFHDDAILSDFEDMSPPALDAYKQAGFPTQLATIKADPDLFKKWTRFKTQALIDLTTSITNDVRTLRTPLKTARNIFAPVLLNPDSEAWFAQNYPLFLKNYDYVALEAMPNLENIPSDMSQEWLIALVRAAEQQPTGLAETIFELQSVDWRKSAESEDRAIPAEVLGNQMHTLAVMGALNFGYYPDDFITNSPDVSVLHKDFSLEDYQYKP